MRVVEPLVRVEGLTKQFGVTRALDDVSLTFHRGEIRALVGENGAGKSTLVKILSGEYGYRAGAIYIDGEPYRPGSPVEAERLGVVRVAQEPATVPELSVAENTYLGHLPRRFGLVRRATLRADARRLYDRLDIPISVDEHAGRLSMAQQQLVSIASALVHEARLLIMDEPTSTITEQETRSLFQLLRQLRERGVSIVFISHRLDEVFGLTDQVTVLRDGRVVGEMATSETTSDQLVSLMVGRNLDTARNARTIRSGPPALEVAGLSRQGAFADVSFSIAAGEIVGLAGLTGSGRSDLARAIYGVDPADGGTIAVNGRSVAIRNPLDAIRRGIGYVPEDRKLEGLALTQPARVNLSLLQLVRLTRFGFVQRARERGLARELVGKLDIRPPDIEARVGTFSGGNQQKVVIGRWLAQELRVLLMDEPTRGVDVGAKAEIHRLMRDLAADGLAILMISSEMDEVMVVPDRILVMHEGRLFAQLDRDTASEEAIVRAASGIAA